MITRAHTHTHTITDHNTAYAFETHDFDAFLHSNKDQVGTNIVT